MFLSSQKLAPWLAIFSLIFSSFLTLTHNHSQSCGCSEPHASTILSLLEDFEGFLMGNCGCCSCCDSEPELPNQNDAEQEHDKDSCSICRMVYEHANHDVEFTFVEFDEPVCDEVTFIVSAPTLSIVYSYLTRGPPQRTA